MAYVGDSFSDLIVTEPDGANEPVSNADDALRQIKRYLVNTLGDPAAAGTIYTAITNAVSAEKTPVGSILRYTKEGIWDAPATYLKCDGKTIGNVSSGAFYESADYEALFDIIKLRFGNAGTEDFNSGDIVKLPNLLDEPVLIGDPVALIPTATTDNGGSLSTMSANLYNDTNDQVLMDAEFDADNMTLTGAPPKYYITGFKLNLEATLLLVAFGITLSDINTELKTRVDALNYLVVQDEEHSETISFTLTDAVGSTKEVDLYVASQQGPNKNVTLKVTADTNAINLGDNQIRVETTITEVLVQPYDTFNYIIKAK